MEKVAVAVVVLLVGMLASCAGFGRYNVGTAELWVGGQVQAERECQRHGAVAITMDSRILGCTDFSTATMISIEDSKVIAHEYCHWSLQTTSHETCPVP